MNKKWNYVEKVGKPTKAGRYMVTLIYPEVEKVGEGYTDDNWKETGRMYASVEERTFMDAKAAGNWVMNDQPDDGLVWTEECGSHFHERVHAWMPMEEVDIAELPDGVVVDNR